MCLTCAFLCSAHHTCPGVSLDRALSLQLWNRAHGLSSASLSIHPEALWFASWHPSFSERLLQPWCPSRKLYLKVWKALFQGLQLYASSRKACFPARWRAAFRRTRRKFECHFGWIGVFSSLGRAFRWLYALSQSESRNNSSQSSFWSSGKASLRPC